MFLNALQARAEVLQTQQGIVIQVCSETENEFILFALGLGMYWLGMLIPGSRVAYPGPDPGPVKLAICPVTAIAFIKALTVCMYKVCYIFR